MPTNPYRPDLPPLHRDRAGQPVLYGPDGEPISLNDRLGAANGSNGTGRHPDPGERVFPLPHVLTYTGIFGSAMRVYSWRWDEAMRTSREDALGMRRDAFLMGLLQERRLATAQLGWHLEPEDAKDQRQKDSAAALTALIKRVSHFQKLLMCLLDAIWYGRYAVGLSYVWQQRLGRRQLSANGFYPINGDKIQYRFRLPGEKEYIEDGTPLILVNPAWIRGVPKATSILTDRGTALVLRDPYWRERFLIHQHEMDDADYFEGEMAGGVQGVGVRHRIYWLDWLRKEWLGNVCDFIQKVGQGVLIFYYEAGNPQSENAAIKAANEMSNNTVIVWPRPIGSEKQGAGVDKLEMSMSGSETLVKLQEHVEGIIERYIVGQTGSSRSESSGLGTHDTEFMADTKYRLTKYDAQNLGDTLTTDLVPVLQRWNRPGEEYRHKWVFEVDKPNAKDQLEAASKAYSMGAPVKTEEVLGFAGLSKPQQGDDVLRNPQTQQQPQQPGGGGGAPGGGGMGGLLGMLGGGQPNGSPKAQPPGQSPNGAAHSNGVAPMPHTVADGSAKLSRDEAPERYAAGTPTEPRQWLQLLLTAAPHLRIIGPTKSGKTVLAQALATVSNDHLVVIDPLWEPGNWGGLPTVTVAPDGDYEPIQQALAALLGEMKRRGVALQEGHADFEPVTIIWDEVPDTVAELPNEAGLLIRRLAQRGRHSKMRLIGISQSDRVESWGLGGYGDAAENFLTVYLGEKATQKVPGLIGAKWPMAVEWRGRVEGLDMHGVLGIAQEPIDGGRLFVLPGVETMPPVDGKGRQQRRERPARFAAGEGGNEWTRQTGPRGASYWVSSRTGRKVYRDTMPGEHDHAGADEPEPGYHRPPTGDLQWVHEHKHAAETHPALGQIAAANEQIIGLLTSDLKPRQKQQQLREVWRGLSTEFKGACLQAATAAAAELAQLTGKPVEKFEGLKNRARIFAAQVLDYLKDDINDATHTLWRSGEDAYPEIKRNAGLDLHMIEHAFYSDVPSEAMSDGKAEQQLQILEKHFLGAARTPEQRQEATEAWILYQGDMRRPAASRAIASQPLRTMTPTANVPERFAAEYHGPTPPSPDWTLVRTGPRGGKVWAPPKAKAATHGYRPDEVAAMSPAQRRMLAGLTHKEEARGKTDAEVQELLAGGEPATAATTDPADHNRQANELLRAIAHGRETGTPDPRGDLAHLPGTDTLNRSLAAIDAAVVRHFQAKGANIPLADLYAEIAPQTGLTPEAFRAVLLHANQVQRYRFSGWPRMPEDHPRPELLPVASGKALGSVGPADQTQHVQAPASTPVASPAAAPATERPSLFNEAPSPDAGQPLTGKTEVRGDDLRAALQLQRQGKLSVSDRYRDVKVPRVEKGQTVHGDPIYGHEYTPDAFILSDATGRPIRHYVTLANGARVHPDELARLKVGKDGQVSLAPDEGLTVIDPVNRGKMRVKSFGRALANVGSYLTGPHDPVTIQSPHGYTVTKPRASWQKEWNESRTLGGPKHGLSFAEWFDRQPTDQAQPDPGEAVPVKPKPPVSAPGFFGGNTVPNRGLFDRFGRREDPEGYERSKSSGSGSCTWITIGAHEGHGGKRSGGSPVCIGKDGRIAKGHPKFTGKKIAALSEKGDARSKPSQHHHLKKQLLQHLDTGEADVGTLQRLTGDKHEPGSPLHEALHELQQSGHVNLHQPRHGPAVVAHTGKVFDEPESEAESPEPSHRQQLAQSRAYERAIWAKKARKSGLKGEHLHQLAAEILAHDREFKKDRTRLLKDARQLSESQGYGSLDTLKARASRGIDADAVRGLDDVAQSVAAKYPEEFNGHEDDLPGRLYDLLLGGNPEPLSEDEAYSEAFDRLTEHQREEERRKRVPATTGFGAAERDRREWKQHRVEQGEEVPFRRSELAKQYERLASEMELLAQKFLSIYSRHS